MGTRGEREGVRAAVRGLLEKDRAVASLKDLPAYQQLFPGFWDLVSEEYKALRAGPVDPPAIPLAPTAPGPTVFVADAAPEKEVERIGPYRILQELGRGGMGVVYLAEDSRIGRKVALKVLAAHFSSSRQLLLRFQREAELAGKLDHPHICTVYEAGEADGTAYMAMRLVEGKPLSDWIGLSKDSKRPSGVVPLPPLEERKPDGKAASGESKRDLDRILELVEKAARALHAAHEKGLIHRDIKPHNIMVTPEGEPVLLDFGLAREEEGEGQQLTQTGSLMGTPAYMSPEQLTAARIKLDRRTDVYSLGATLYECLTLRLPFEAPTLDGLYQKILSTDPEDPRRLNRAIPRDLEVVVATALEKDRDRRYQTAEALAEEVRRVREHEPIQAKSVGLLGRLARWSQRSPGMAASLSALLLSLTAGLALSLNFLKAARLERDAKEEALVAERTASQTARRERDAKMVALEATRQALRRSRLMGLRSAAAAAEPASPMEALLLAREAARIDESPATDLRLREALAASRERAILAMPGTSVLSAVFSPRGDRVATACSDGTVRLWSREGAPLSLLIGHEGAVRSACFSPGGDRILTAGDDGTARLWDASGASLSVLQGHDGAVRALYSLDGTRILTYSADGTARLWGGDGTEGPVLRGHSGAVLSAAFFPDGGRVATTSIDGTARLWGVDGSCVAVLDRRLGPMRAAAVSPLGDRLLTAPDDGTAVLWAHDGRRLAVLPGSPMAVVVYACFSPSGDRILTTSQGGTVRLWDSEGRPLASLNGHTRLVTRGAFSPDGEWIATAGNDRTARLWDRSGNPVAVLRGHDAEVGRAEFSPSGGRLLTASPDGTARLWDLESGEAGFLRSRAGDVVGAFDAPDGPVVAATGQDGVVRLLDMQGGERAVLRGHSAGVWSVRVSAAGDRVATASLDGTARLWDMAGRELAVFRGHEKDVLSATLSPAGDRVATASLDGTVRLWEPGGREVRMYPLGAGSVRVAAFSPLGDLLLTARPDNRVCLFRLDDGMGGGVPDAPVAELAGHTRIVRGVAFAPSGDRFLTGSADGSVRLWDLSGKCLVVVPDHGGAVESVALSGSGDRFLTGSVDGTARLWDLEGRELARFPGHQGPGGAQGAIFVHGGDRVLTWAGDGAVRIWLTRHDALLELADSRISRDFTPQERAKYADLLEPMPGAGK